MARPFYIRTNLDREIKKTLRDVDKYDDKTRDALRKAVQDGTARTMQQAKDNVHSVTGVLVGRIRKDYDKTKNVGRVQSLAPHSHFLESGVGMGFVLPRRKKVLKASGFFFTHAVIPRRKARPFMQPALDKARPKIERDVKRAVEP